MTYSADTLSPRQNLQVSLSGLPQRHLGLSMSDLDGYKSDSTLTVAERWLEGVRSGQVIRATGKSSCGRGLLLYGPPGTGKTALACALTQELVRTSTREVWKSGEHRMDRPVFFATYPKILELMKARMDGDDKADSLIKSFHGDDLNSAVRLLVIDDLGKEHRHANHWAETMFDHLLRNRFDEGWPTIVTTNVAPREWSGIYGEAMASFAHEAFDHLAIMAVVGDRRLS